MFEVHRVSYLSPVPADILNLKSEILDLKGPLKFAISNLKCTEEVRGVLEKLRDMFSTFVAENLEASSEEVL
jgi:hypothetical protein